MGSVVHSTTQKTGLVYSTSNDELAVETSKSAHVATSHQFSARPIEHSASMRRINA